MLTVRVLKMALVSFAECNVILRNIILQHYEPTRAELHWIRLRLWLDITEIFLQKISSNMEWIWCRTWAQMVMQRLRSTWYHSLQVRTRIKHRNAFIKRVRIKLLSSFIRQWFVIRAKFEISHSGWFVRRSSRNCRFTICIHTSRYVMLTD